MSSSSSSSSAPAPAPSSEAKAVYGPQPYRLEDSNWEPEDPIFMSKLPENLDSSEALRGLQALQEESTPEDRAEGFKDQGNELVKLGAHHYKDAIKSYTQAIDEHINDNKKNSIYYSNRAFVNFKLQNYGKVIEDCKIAVQLNPNNFKAYYRAASAQLELKKFQDAIDLCETALQHHPKMTKSIAEVKTKAEDGLNKVLARQRQKEAEQQKKEADVQVFQQALRDRGYVMGKRVFKANGQYGDGEPQWRDGDPATGEIVFPVLFLYPEYDQSDHIRVFSEGDTFEAHLETMFPEPHSAPWDARGDYVHNKLSVYLRTNDTDEENGQKNYKKQEWKRIKRTSTLFEALREPGYIIPGTPIFHVFVQGSPFLRDYMEKNS